jgi:hypothetical protein
MFAARLEAAALLRAARIVASTGIVGALIALRRCVLGRGQIAAALRVPSTSTSTAPAKASSAAIAATVAAEVLSAAAIIAFVAWARVFLRGIELPKILRSRRVRFRLALLGFGLRQAISFRLTSAVPFVTQRRLVLVLVGEICAQRLLVGDSLLREVISA